MSDFRKCSICEEWMWPGGHRCAPLWVCRVEWCDEDDWMHIYAQDAERAAAKCAEKYDREGGEYTIVNGRHREVIILVRTPDDESPVRYFIEAESVPQYHAHRAR